MKRKKWTWLAAAVLLCVLMAAVYAKSMGGTAAEVSKATAGEIKQYLEETAVVQSKEKQTVYIENAGKITGIKAEAGDNIKQGDLLLEMDKADMELQLRDANAKVDAARAQLKGSDMANYADKIEVAKAEVEQARVAYDSAARNFENSKKLYETGALSKEDFDKAQDAFKTAGATLNSANYQLNDVRRGMPEYEKSSYMAQLEQVLTARDTILRNLDKLQVKAPMDGMILEKLIEVNTPVTAGTAAFVVGNMKKLELQADILADDMAKVKLGNDVEISGKAIGDAVIKGKVSKIAPAAKNITSNLGVNQKRVPVTIDISEGGAGILKPGYNVDIKVITAAKKNAVIVPDSSVFDYQGKSCVLAVRNGRTELAEVKKGIESSKSIEVLEGLKEGEPVLTNPDNTVKAGMKIKPVWKKD